MSGSDEMEVIEGSNWLACWLACLLAGCLLNKLI